MKSPIQQLVKAMRSTGNGPGIMAQWVGQAHQWTLDHKGPESDAIKAWLPYFQVRPFYTAEELAPLFPALIAAAGLMVKPPQYSPERLANELDYWRLPCVRNRDGSTWFRNPAERKRIARFYIVERVHFWQTRELTQERFEEVYRGQG